MKRILLIAIVLQCLSFAGYSQCQKITRSVAGTGFTWQYGVHFVSADTIVVVGNGGISKSYDQGATWTKITLPSLPAKDFRSLSFVDNKIGFTAGNKGIVLKTEDAGESWTNVSTSTTQRFRAVHFHNKDTGYAAGNNSTAYRTYNGGISWDSLSTAPNGHTYTAVFSKGKGEVYLGGTSGAFYRSLDHGSTWTNITAGDTMVSGIDFPTQDTGYACTNRGIVMKTIDGGNTWLRQSTNNTDGYWAIKFSRANIGYAGGGYGRLYTTRDGGKTWYNAKFARGNEQEIRALSVFGDSLAITVNGGAERNLIKTMNTGVKPTLTEKDDTLFATTSSNYQWYVNSVKKTLDQNWYVLDSSGYYQVVTNNSGCYAISDPYLYGTVSVEEKMMKLDFTIYPNPAANKLIVSPLDGPMPYIIYNLAGKIIQSGTTNGAIDITSIVTGTYLLEIGMNSTKIVVEK